VVASRFHSVVAAISMATPFLALGWSHKYRELVEETGLNNAVLDGRGLGAETLIMAVERLWNERMTTREQLKRVTPKLKQSAAREFDLIEEILAKN
jgi:colanic acid/amylovoran biosynthesis protein